MPDALLIRTRSDIAEAKRWLDRLADVMPGRIGELIVKRRTRSNDQNALMWARLEDIAKQAEWDGLKLDKYDWKTVLMGGWLREKRAEMRIVANWQRTGLEALGYRSSKLDVEEMTEFLEFIAFAAAHLDVTLRDQQEQAA